MKQDSNRDIEFFYEIGQLRLIKRMWRRFFQSETSNLAEHTLRVIWIALAIAKREKVEDEDKIMKMALVHDITESRTGDVDHMSRQYAELKEDMAAEDMLKETTFEDEFLDIWREFDKKESIEAKIVKDADNLDVNLELREQEIQSISGKLLKTRNDAVRSKLYTETAKKYWDLIGESEIHDWHLLGRNRFNSGDWKEK